MDVCLGGSTIKFDLIMIKACTFTSCYPYSYLLLWLVCSVPLWCVGCGGLLVVLLPYGNMMCVRMHALNDIHAARLKWWQLQNRRAAKMVARGPSVGYQ